VERRGREVGAWGRRLRGQRGTAWRAATARGALAGRRPRSTTPLPLAQPAGGGSMTRGGGTRSGRSSRSAATAPEAAAAAAAAGKAGPGLGGSGSSGLTSRSTSSGGSTPTSTAGSIAPTSSTTTTTSSSSNSSTNTTTTSSSSNSSSNSSARRAPRRGATRPPCWSTCVRWGCRTRRPSSGPPSRPRSTARPWRWAASWVELRNPRLRLWRTGADGTAACDGFGAFAPRPSHPHAEPRARLKAPVARAPPNCPPQWHPDKHVHAGGEARTAAEARFKAARAAYEALLADHRAA
jgi:hypothetical protein